jgi:hypothetical protein
MPNTLTYNATAVVLPDEMAWPDEFGWSPVEQSTERSITGELVVDVAAKVGGRQITLQGGDDYGWMTRAQVASIEAWRAIPAAEMQLVFRGVARTVIFDHERTALEYVAIVEWADPEPTDPCAVTLRFIEV